MIISPYSFGSSGGGGGSTLNPAWSNVVLALDGDGSNGSAVVDSKNGYTPNGTYLGGVEISTSDGKFGGSSIKFDGSGGLIYASGSADPNFQFAGDFCIRGFVKCDGTLANPNAIVDTRDSNSSSTGFVFFIDSADGLLKFYTGTAYVYIASAVFPTAAWTHLAVTRSGTDFRIFQDGAQMIGLTQASNFSAGRFSVGDVNHSYANGTATFSGFMDNFEVVNGEPVYTIPFVAPTSPYPDM